MTSCGQLGPEHNRENSKTTQFSSDKTPSEMSTESGIVPFSFEPVHGEGSEESDTGSSSSETCQEELLLDKTVRVQSTHGRSSQPAHEWCQCQRCSSDNMRDAECVCCTEWTLLDSRLGGEMPCISGHPDLAVLCLNRVVLVSMWPYVMAFKGIRGPIPRELTNR